MLVLVSATASPGCGHMQQVCQDAFMIRPELVTRLRCPLCKDVFHERDAHLECAAGHRMTVADGYIDALSRADDEATRRTEQSFGYEWTTFDAIEAEDEQFWQVYFRDVPLGELAQAVALDAGCGKGRYSFFLAPHVRELVALDGSAAVESAVRNLAPLPNVTVVKADLRQTLFVDGSFDFITCLGVLHHLADPQAGFDALVRLLAPGGRILVYLYSRPESFGARSVGLAGASAIRAASRRMPYPALRAFSAVVAGGLYAGVVAPGALGARMGVDPLRRLPLAGYRGKPLRSLWLDTFDRLSAPLERRYIWAELEPWFRANTLEVEAVREEAGLFILARRPVHTHAAETQGAGGVAGRAS